MKTQIRLALTTALLTTSIAYAGDKEDIAELKQQVKELQEMTQTLTDETSDLKTGFNYTTVDESKRYTGLGPAASKVYYSSSPLSIGGYGEMYYSNTESSDDPTLDSSQTEVKRFITYFGYKFSDNIILNAELEYEGGGVTADGTGDTVAVEFMYLDFLLNKNFNLRVGNFLVPMGLTNEQHEPTIITTVARPSTAKYIIPSTWNESGVMAYGEIIQGVEYKVALINALKPTDTGDKWIRNGRNGAYPNSDVRFASVLRVDYSGTSGLLAGVSLYNDADILMMDAHMDYSYKGARIYGTYAQTSRSTQTIGAVTKLFGGYINGSYDILSLTNLNYKMPLFVQYEVYNPQLTINQGVSSSQDTKNTTLGINFFPHEQVVLKADYMFSSTGSIDSTIASLSLGFVF